MDIKYIPTISEYVKNHIKSSDSIIKIIVDDFCDYPGPEDAEGEDHDFKLKRNNLLQQFQKRVDDIVVAHRFIVHQYNVNAEKLAPLFMEYDKEYSGMFTDLLKENNASKIAQFRMGFSSFNMVCETMNSKLIADEQLIVSLWATTEKYIKKY